MKRAVSISLGSSERDKKVEVELLGERVSVERRGTDGDIAKVTALFTELDGQVDALGVGGIDLWVKMDDKSWNISAAHKLVQGVKQTPVVDGSGLKNTLEAQAAQTLVALLIAPAAFGANPHSLALLETKTVPPHPAFAAGRHPYHQSVVRHVSSHHRPGPDKRVTPEGSSANDGCVGANAGPATHPGGLVFAPPNNLGARVNHVGEHARGATEDVVFENDPGVERDVVLDLDVVAHRHAVAHQHVVWL